MILHLSNSRWLNAIRQCHEQGAIVPELAVGVLLLLTTLLTGADLLRMSANASACQFVATKLMREIVINDLHDKQPAESLPDYFQRRAAEIARPLGVSFNPVTDICINLASVVPCDPATDSVGGEREIVQVSITKDLNAIFPPGTQLHVTGLAVGRIEPF